MKNVFNLAFVLFPVFSWGQVLDSVFVDSLSTYLYRIQNLSSDTSFENRGCYTYVDESFTINTSYSWGYSNSEVCTDAAGFIGKISAETNYSDERLNVESWIDSLETYSISTLEYTCKEFSESALKYHHLILIHVPAGNISMHSTCLYTNKDDLLEILDEILLKYRYQFNLI